MAAKVEIAFLNALAVGRAREPYFISDRGIEGSISVSSSQDFDFDLVKVSLEGVLVNSVRYAEWGSAQGADARKVQVLLRMSDIRKSLDFTTVEREGRTVRKATFNFHIPQCLGRNLLGEDSEYLSDLPASLSCSSMKSSSVQGQSSAGASQIHYTILADVIRNGKIVTTKMKSVYILPSLQPRPPIYVADFGTDYITWNTKALKANGKLSLSKIGNCTIRASEPAAVILRRLDAPVTVSIPLKVIVQLHCQPSDNPASRRGERSDNFLIQQQAHPITSSAFSCRSALVSSTYISVVPLQKVPSQIEAVKTTTLSRNTSVCSRAITTITPMTGWTRHPEKGHLEMDTCANLKFDTFKQDGPIIPSFDSAMISQRYTVALKIQVNTSSRMTFNLDVPVTIRYCSDPSQNNDTSPPADSPPSFDEIHPGTESDSESSSPPTPMGDLDEQFTNLNIHNILHDHQQWDSIPLHPDVYLSIYDPRLFEIDAPPYVS